MKPRQLALLVAIADTGSLRQAADRVHVSQPAASRLLLDLEGALGVPLFERSRQGMSINAAGQVMVDHARALLVAMQEAADSARAVAEGRHGVVRLGIFGSAAPGRLAAAVAQFKRASPELSVQINEAPLDMLLGALRDGALDIVVSHLQARRLLSAFEVVPLYQESFVIACGAAHPLARRRRIAMTDLIGYHWIVPPADTQLRQSVDEFFLRAFGCEPESRVESASLLGNLALLTKSDALGIVARQIADFFGEQGVLRMLPLDPDLPRRPVALVTLRNRPANAQTRRLIELIRAQFVSNER